MPLIRNEEIVPLPVFETYASRADLVTEIQQDSGGNWEEKEQLLLLQEEPEVKK